MTTPFKKGIGFACAKELLDFGASVIICSRSADSVNHSVDLLKAHCDSQAQTVVGYVCDVSTRQGRSA